MINWLIIIIHASGNERLPASLLLGMQPGARVQIFSDDVNRGELSLERICVSPRNGRNVHLIFGRSYKTDRSESTRAHYYARGLLHREE